MKGRIDVSRLVIAWVLLVPMMFFIARGTFSFDRTAVNNTAVADQAQTANTSAGSNYYRAEQILIYLIVVVVMAGQAPAILRSAKIHWKVFLLPTWALLSTLWSQDAEKSLRLGVGTFILTLFALYFYERFSRTLQLELMLFYGAIAIAISYGLCLLFPEAGIDHVATVGAWRGMFEHKNQCAIITTYLLIPALEVQSKNALVTISKWTYIAAGLGLIALSQSRTGWLLVVVMICINRYLSVIRRFQRTSAALITFVVLSICAAIASAVIANYQTIAPLIGKDASLTGRVQIWSVLLHEVTKRPIIGFGYMAFFLGNKGESAQLVLVRGMETLTNAENPVLQLGLELGAVGVLIYLTLLILSLRNMTKSIKGSNDRYYIWMSTVVLLAVVELAGASKILYPNTYEWFIFVVAFIALEDAGKRDPGYDSPDRALL